MNIWTYDKTFEGFLTLVFDCYEMKTFPDKILGNVNRQESIFPAGYEVISNETKAKRVWNGLGKKISGESCQMLYHRSVYILHCRLSQTKISFIFKFVSYIFDFVTYYKVPEKYICINSLTIKLINYEIKIIFYHLTFRGYFGMYYHVYKM